MGREVIARKQQGWLVISNFPDVCKTPVGCSLIPVPYPVVAKLTQGAEVVKSVRANGHPILVYKKSIIVRTLGDQAGIGKGFKSSTMGGKCYPKTHSKTVKANRKYVIRHNDKFWMNGR